MTFQQTMRGANAIATHHEGAQKTEHKYKQLFEKAGLEYWQILDIHNGNFPEGVAIDKVQSIASKLEKMGWTPPEYD